jgi:hypothetical protein
MTDNDLSQYDQDWATTEAAPDTNNNVPEGKYIAKVEKVEKTKTGPKSKNPGSPMLKWQLRITGGNPEGVGRVVFTRHQMASKENLSWLKRDLKTCGLELAKLSDLDTHLKDLLDVSLEINVKNKVGKDGQENQNVYFNKKADAAAASSGTDSDIPF